MSNTATTNVKTHSPRVQSVAIVTITKIFDAASDPLVGSIIDRTHTRWGKLRPFVLFSAAPVAILTGLLFSVPNTTEPLKLVFFGVCYLLWGSHTPRAMCRCGVSSVRRSENAPHEIASSRTWVPSARSRWGSQLLG